MALPAVAPLLWVLLPPRLPRLDRPRPRPLLLRPPCCCSMLCLMADQRWCSVATSCLPALQGHTQGHAYHTILQLISFWVHASCMAASSCLDHSHGN